MNWEPINTAPKNKYILTRSRVTPTHWMSLPKQPEELK